jgi:RHS repeat-associated protein
LNRLRTISSKAFGGSASALLVAFDYQYNAANQRTRVNREDGAYWVYTYDDLGQVISGRKYWGDGTEVAGQHFDYAFDTIGNRTATGGRASAVSAYTPNRLNQYSQRTVPSQVDVQGVANPTANVTVRVVDGTTFTAARKGEYYRHALNVGNNVYPEVEVKSLYGSTQTQTGRVFNRPATETFTYDADGNLTQDGRWTYVWDGENRLIEMKRDTGTPPGARQRLVFEYDHQGRRIRKRFDTHNGSGWDLGPDTAFAYDGWNLVAELNAASSNTRIRTYLWGLDLSGSEQGAGGVGGLWLVTDYTTVTYHWPACDGNGNVAALVAQANGSLSARYEYGPFGETLRATCPMAKQNPFRFSTKYTDNETGLLYYGYRYYDPVTGRWPNRDPIGEDGGFNLYKFVYNSPGNRIDPKGLNSLLSVVSGCAMSLLTESIDKKLDQQFVCKELADRMRGVTEPRKGEQDAYDIDLCNDFYLRPYFPPGHHPASVAKTLRNCILSGLKGKAVEKALEEVTDPVKLRILEKLLNAASDPDVDASINVKVDVKCVNKKAQLTLNYSTAVSVNGRSATLENQTVGPFGCSIGTQLFGGKKLDDCCAKCARQEEEEMSTARNTFSIWSMLLLLMSGCCTTQPSDPVASFLRTNPTEAKEYTRGQFGRLQHADRRAIREH